VNDALLSSDARTTAGVLLLTIVAVEWGGLFMLRLVRGSQPATQFQHAFARAGHAHAGVLVIFALVAQMLADAADLTGSVATVGRNGIPLAAILMPAGFSSPPQDAAPPGPTDSFCSCTRGPWRWPWAW
jgi:hypothetical protein